MEEQVFGEQKNRLFFYFPSLQGTLEVTIEPLANPQLVFINNVNEPFLLCCGDDQKPDV